MMHPRTKHASHNPRGKDTNPEPPMQFKPQLFKNMEIQKTWFSEFKERPIITGREFEKNFSLKYYKKMLAPNGEDDDKEGEEKSSHHAIEVEGQFEEPPQTEEIHEERVLKFSNSNFKKRKQFMRSILSTIGVLISSPGAKVLPPPRPEASRILGLINLSTRILSIHGNYPLRDFLLHDTNNYGILSRWQSYRLCLLHLRDIFPYLSFRGSRRDPWTRPITPSIKRPLLHHSKVHTEHTPYFSSELFHLLSSRWSDRHAGGVLSGLAPALYFCSSVQVALQASEAQCRGNRATLTVGCSPRFLPQQFGAVCGNDSSQSSMHLRSRNLPRPNASSPLNEDHERNNGRLMQLLAAANPPLPAAPPVPDIERSRHSNRSGDRSQNVSANRVGRRRRQAPSSSLREKSSSESSKTPTRSRRGRSPHRGDHIRARDKSTSQKIRDLDGRLDAINTGTNAPVTMDTLIRQTEPPFTRRVLRAQISSKFKLPTQLGIYEGKTDPMDHLNSYKSLMLLQGCSDEIMCKAFSRHFERTCQIMKNVSHLFTVHQKETESLKDFVKRFNQAILEVEDPSDKVIIMAMMEGLRPGPLFDSLSKNVPETLSALQSKADKYIAAEELAEAKQRRRGKDDHKRKEPDTRRNDYREETRYKRPHRDPKRSNNRRPRTPPCRPNFILPPLNAPVAQVLSKIKHEEFVKWPEKIMTDPQKRNRNKYCEFHRDHGHNTEDCFQLKEQIADLIKRGYLRRNQDNHLNLSPEGRDLFSSVHSIAITGHGRRHTKMLRDEVERLTLVDPRETNNTKPLEEVVPISIHPDYPDRHIMIGTELTDELRFALVNFLKKNYDVFAWSQGDVPSIDPEIAMHKLFTNPESSPVRQKRRKFAPERLKVIEDEVDKLIRANVVREAHYPDWLANVVVAPQKGGKWRVCVDFTDLNKACPKDSFPLPKIDLIVDATSKHELLRVLWTPSRDTTRSKCTLLTLRKLLLSRSGDYIVTKFVSKSADKCLPFFKILRKSQAFQWNEESENAFQQLKEYLGSPPLLTVPTTGEDLYIYLSISPTAVSAVLIREEDQVQRPIYYVSKVLMGAEARYPRIEKLTYALMIAARKLRHYFQAHPIIVLTDQPLKHILQRPDTSGRLLNGPSN
ncbi:hypothetical protein Acr_09g0001640 [Actinidia rufa]|uniref:Reverse transcriptase/retrotransposon-derived protein RNase H-like domain-containing protein n=1 Tax=Actinidia rufa TaxID=165716 RepID=A0A7J0F4U5_9ERIC|nr:hypothetical protein Acr_09g0001640 [Actinidia rufa]